MIAAADLAACRAQLANGSRTFLAASRLLPRSVRDAACALYAFCRIADDAVDQAVAEHAPAAVATLRRRLDLIYARTPIDCAADRALAAVVVDHRIDRTLLDALIEGFAWDAEGRRFETIDELHAYAARVAGTVGAMMALLMDTRGAAEIARACDLGVAMQLSNIARDVGEDARNGRIYLPLAWMREAGIDADRWLLRPMHSAALASVVARLLAEADRLYARVGCGIARLPAPCRPGINAARHLYAAIGHEVARRGFDSVEQRAVVSAPRKIRLLMTASLGAWLPATTQAASMVPLVATQFLVDAAADHDLPTAVAAAARQWTPRARALRLIDLIDRLERRDRRDPRVHAGGVSGAAA